MDDSARHALIFDHLDEAVAHGRRVARRRLDRDEAAGVARLALVEAAADFDPALGHAFGAYLQTRVRRATWAAIRANAPVHVDKHLYNPRERRSEATRSAARRGVRRALSLGEPAGAATVGETIPARDPGPDLGPDPDEIATLTAKLAALDAVERAVVAAHYGLGGAAPRSLRRIAAGHGYDEKWARRRHSRALARLRTPGSHPPSGAKAGPP